MGGCGSTSKTDATSAKIDKKIAKSNRSNKVDIKMLLLGTGESGKSTFVKQIKIIHLGGFSTEERFRFKDIVFEDILYSVQGLLSAAKNNKAVLEKKTEIMAEKFMEMIIIDNSDENLAKEIKTIYEDPGIKKMFEYYTSFHLLDCAEYMLSSIERIFQPDYVPTIEDLLRSRVKTTGVQELKLEIEHNNYVIIDVGGQRSERKKWIHCFQDVTAVLFFVALSEYVLKLYEDEETNRMIESLKLFDEICNSKWFSTTPIILFLNKSDLFAERIKKMNITEIFPLYEGKQNFDEASQFIQKSFVDLNQNPEKEIYSHITCATNTDNIRSVLNDVQSIVLQTLLSNSGF